VVAAILRDLTRERLQQVLHYCLHTGIFTWRVAVGVGRGFRSAGAPAGCIQGRGYMQIMVDGRRHYTHRLAWLYMTGSWPEQHVDHVNGDRCDNRWRNLRAADHSVNNQNRRKASRNNKLGVIGVSKKGNRFIAQITFDGRCHHIGSFETAELAHAAYLEVKRNRHQGSTL
jgi:hypothetical protein